MIHTKVVTESDTEKIHKYVDDVIDNLKKKMLDYIFAQFSDERDDVTVEGFLKWYNKPNGPVIKDINDLLFYYGE